MSKSNIITCCYSISFNATRVEFSQIFVTKFKEFLLNENNQKDEK